MKKQKYTITDFREDFPDDNACLEWLKNYLYPDGIFCPIDKKITPHHRMKTRKSYSCELCGHHVHPTADTIFHKSSTPLTLWFYAVYLMASTRAGISAKQLERELGVTYKTAWRMFHQIRKMMNEGGQLGGEVEIDETYMGGSNKWRKNKKPSKDGQEVVFGMVERKGRAKAIHVKSAGNRVLVPEIEKNIEYGAQIYSDEFQSYKHISRLGYKHAAVKHVNEEFVKGPVHTQNVDNLWSNMKRGVRGVYRHVGAKYLQAYVDEYSFRYSHRNDYQHMFWAILDKVNRA